jgi:hypothetical protein
MRKRTKIDLPHPKRSGPKRSFAGIYHHNERLRRETAHHKSKPAQDETMSKMTASQPGDGVRIAYKIIEKYLNDGKRAAQAINTQLYGESFKIAPVQDLIDKLLRFQAEMIPIWLDVLGSFARTDVRRSRLADAVGAVAGANGVPGSAGVAIEVSSSKPAEVRLNLVDSARRLALVSAGLHSVEAKDYPTIGVRFAPESPKRSARLSITVPPGQPSGMYCGVLVDRDSHEVQGSVSVHVIRKRLGTKSDMQ